MSSALAIAAVTAVMKNLLDNRLVQYGLAAGLGDVKVTALPPDRISVGEEERSQLNLFLYRVTPNTGWRLGRLEASPGQDGGPADHASPPATPPLALDLHYLLTAYGEQDFQAEILLGHAMQALLQTSVLTRDRIRSALAAPDGSGGVAPPTRAVLTASTLADQVQEVRISPEFIGSEELSRLWSALQAHFRPSAVYKVSTVLLGAEGEAPDGAAGRAPSGDARPATGTRPRGSER
jgi:Pvc16 N-terminal domain